MRRIKMSVAAALAFMLVILAGCQAVGGLDVNKVMLDSLAVKSSESSQTVSVELVASSQASAEDLEIIKLINSFSIKVNSAKMENASTMSMKGAVSLDGKELPFHVYLDQENITFWVEGAKLPISVALGDLEGLDADIMPSDDETLELAKDIMGFFLKHTPNPSTISLNSVTEKVNGEELSLRNLHVELRGDELVGLVKTFLSSVVKDKEGITELVTVLYDSYAPVLEASMAMYDEEYAAEAEALSAEEKAAMKKAAVEELVDEVIFGINGLLPTYDESVKELLAETPELNQVLSKDTVLAVDMMIDNNLHIRKQNIDLTIQLPTVEDLPIQKIKVKSTTEQWNVNGKVTAERVDTSKGKLEFDLLEENITPGTLLRNFDSQSDVYRFLKEDMQITHKFIVLDTVYDEDNWYADYPTPIVVQNTTLVPLRYVSEELDAQVKWDGKNKQVTIVDDLSGSVIVLKSGSKQAKVDGNVVTLTQPAQIKDGSVFVPLRFVAEALGTTVQWNKEDQIIVIERD